MFAASKIQGTIPSTSAPNIEKGKKKVKRVRKGKKDLKKEPGIIDLDSENEDKERAHSILLQGKK